MPILRILTSEFFVAILKTFAEMKIISARENTTTTLYFCELHILEQIRVQPVNVVQTSGE
jgi:hypothetical protein